MNEKMEIIEKLTYSTFYNDVYEIDEEDFINWCVDRKITEIDDDVWDHYKLDRDLRETDSYPTDSYLEGIELDSSDEINYLQSKLDKIYETRA